MRAIAIGVVALAAWLGGNPPAGAAATVTDQTEKGVDPSAALFSTDVRDGSGPLAFPDLTREEPIAFDPHELVEPDSNAEGASGKAIEATEFGGALPVEATKENRRYSVTRAMEILDINPQSVFEGLGSSDLGSSGALGASSIETESSGGSGSSTGSGGFGGYGDYRTYDQHDDARDRRLRQLATGTGQGVSLGISVDIDTSAVRDVADIVPGSGQEQRTTTVDQSDRSDVSSVLGVVSRFLQTFSSLKLSSGLGIFLMIIGLLLLGALCFAGYRRLRSSAT